MAQSYTFTTLAGGTTSGSNDGSGSAAKFNFPWGMAADRSGNIFVADSANHTIRKISAGGVVTTVAGLAGSSGNVDGVGSAARFDYPYGVAVDASGNLFVACGSHTIRKITSSGVVTTLAGTAGFHGSTDGTGTAAQFFFPYGVAVDAAGTVYVADTSNDLIRKITSSGVVTTLAGGNPFNTFNPDGVGRAASFRDPHGVAVDGAGNVYVADTLNSRIRKITPDGTVTTLAGSRGGSAGGYVDGPGSGALFAFPFGIAVDGSGNLYVADTSNHAVRKLTAAGVVTTLGGVGETSGYADGTGTAARFKAPCGVAVDDAGNLFVGDAGNHAIRKGVASTETPPNPGRLVNLSILTNITSSDPSFTVGTVLGGGGTSGNKALLVRAAGPSLTPLGVSGALADPKLDFFGGQNFSFGNDNWDGGAFLKNAFTSVGAFPYASDTSRDAAIYFTNLSAGNYTVQVSGVGGATGAVIAELYDATPADFFTNLTPRLVNVSVLKKINAGETLTTGFVIGGATSKQVLIRAVGPTLGTAPFNVPGVMADPRLDLFSGQTPINSNDNWSGGNALTAAFTNVGAFALPAASKDAALLLTLQPGSYTAQVSGVGGASGLTLVEVYEAP